MEKTKSLRLAFVYHVPFWEQDGQIWTNFPPIGSYVESLTPHYKKVTIISPQRSDIHMPLYCLQASNISLITVKPHPNIQSYYLHLLHFYFSCFQSARDWDLLNVRMPTFLGFPAYLASRFYRKPVFLVVVGENYSFNTFSDYSRIKKWIAGTVARIQDSLMKKMIRHSLTFTNGKDLFEKYKPLNDHTYLMRSSTISAADILPGYRSTCNKKPYKILTVAIVAPRKGTSLIPAIISILKQKGIDVTWTHIGNIDGNAGEQELQKTMKLAADLGVSSQINFHEAIGFDELMPVYRSSDMFVLPTYMEGIPRVILEAQASGLPVITTSVGGIPQVVKQGVDGLLTSPGDSQAMAEAIRQIIQNSNLRQKLIRNGLQTARELTLESETRRMVEKVNDYYYSTHDL